MKKPPIITTDEWLAAREELERMDNESVEGMTLADLERKWNCCRTTASRLLHKMLDAGMAKQVGKRKERRNNGSASVSAVYQLVGKGKG